MKIELEGCTIHLQLDTVRLNPNNPRRDETEEGLADLAASIREHGVLCPILVRPAPFGEDGCLWEVIAGERRVRASRLAKLTQVPALVCRRVQDDQALALALTENLQRRDLDPIAEAIGVAALAEANGWTQERAAEALGCCAAQVSHILRRLTLPLEVQELARTGKLSRSHLDILAGEAEPTRQILMAYQATNLGLNARELKARHTNGKRKVTAGEQLLSSLEAAARRGWQPAAEILAAHPKPTGGAWIRALARWLDAQGSKG